MTTLPRSCSTEFCVQIGFIGYALCCQHSWTFKITTVRYEAEANGSFSLPSRSTGNTVVQQWARDGDVVGRGDGHVIVITSRRYGIDRSELSLRLPTMTSQRRGEHHEHSEAADRASYRKPRCRS